MEEGQVMRQRVLGLVCFCIGFGMVLAIIVPALGWAFVASIALLCAGYFMAKGC